jgi:predicted RND superfamily exporter protein
VIPKRWVEAYLRFLLHYRLTVAGVVGAASLAFVLTLANLKIHTDFFDFYPPEHPYIRMYEKFRRMFGSANILTMILEVKDGDIYNPTTLQKLDRMTKYVIGSRGVIPYQILSIAHPKVKSISTYAGAIQIRAVYHPDVPQTQADADRVKFSVYSTRGIRGLLVSQNDRAAAIHAGFWEEALDFHYLYDRLMALKAQEEDENHHIYITGFPWLFTSIMRYVPDIGRVFVLTGLALSFLLWNYFRTWTGVWVPIFSGFLSSVWGLGLASVLGFNLDPLVLVIPIFLTARALSHSVQSMDRYHEEYHRLGDKNAAIVESYSHLFAPAIASIITDGVGLLIIAGGFWTSLSLNTTLAIAVSAWIAMRVPGGPRRWTLIGMAVPAFALSTVVNEMFATALVVSLALFVALTGWITLQAPARDRPWLIAAVLAVFAASNLAPWSLFPVALLLNLTLFVFASEWITRVPPGIRRAILILLIAAAALLVSTFIAPRLFTGALIPLIRKVAIFASFWVVSIFISVVTLHPIILSAIDPPGVRSSSAFTRIGAVLAIGTSAAFAVWSVVAFDVWRLLGPGTWAAIGLIVVVLARWSEQVYSGLTAGVIALSAGWRRWAMIAATVVFLVGGWSYGRTLRVGDMTPGAALLFPDHSYNVAYRKLNEQFLGASQLIIIADTGKEDGMKNVEPLTIIEEFADHMETAEGAAASITIIDIVKELARLYHEGEPKWGFVPDNPKHVAELFYIFTQTGTAGDLDRFMDTTARYGSITTLFHGYSHRVITSAIDWAKKFAAMYGGPQVEFLFAGGLFGVLAAVNEAVESSYWINLAVILAVVTLCLYFTYGSWTAAFILMIPVVMSQVVCEAIMVIYRIDLNVNSLPIAGAGAAVGVDYGIYHFSRMLDAFDEGRDVDDAVDYATATTGKAILFTATTMLAGTIFWWFGELKFQAEMGMLLALLMGFNTFGGLVVVPALVKVLRPAFLVRRRSLALERQEQALAAAG